MPSRYCCTYQRWFLQYRCDSGAKALHMQQYHWPSINSYTPPSVGFSSTYTTLSAGEAEAIVAAIAEVHGKSCRGPPRNGFEPKWLRINVRPKLARRPAQSDTSDVRLEEQTVESDKSRVGEGEPILGGGSGIPHDLLKFTQDGHPSSYLRPHRWTGLVLQSVDFRPNLAPQPTKWPACWVVLKLVCRADLLGT